MSFPQVFLFRDIAHNQNIKSFLNGGRFIHSEESHLGDLWIKWFFWWTRYLKKAGKYCQNYATGEFDCI